MNDDDFEKEILNIEFQQVTDIIKKNPNNWTSKLEDLGFVWYDDEDDTEEIEESRAKPENLNQEFLIAYFNGQVSLSAELLETYYVEKNSNRVNYPLIRKFYKQGNPHLRRLLFFGLDKNAIDIGLLDDLSYFSEFGNILSELIDRYLIACDQECDLDKFEKLARDFFYNTAGYDYNALFELSQRYKSNLQKISIVQSIIKEIHSESQDIEF